MALRCLTYGAGGFLKLPMPEKTIQADACASACTIMNLNDYFTKTFLPLSI